MVNKTVLKFVLGLKIRQLRNKKNYSLKKLSEVSGLSHSYLNEIEKGKKYPKVEKLLGLAEALNVNLEELVSVKMGRNLHPLLNFLQTDWVKKISFDIFGLSEQDIYGLMSHSPEKFASFVVTILEVSRNYDMNIEDLYQASLRSYQEINDNFFPDIEKLAIETRKEFKKDNSDDLYDALKNELESQFKTKICEEELTKNKETRGMRQFCHYSSSGNLLLINNHLSTEQKLFVLTKELAKYKLNVNRKNVNEPKEFSDILSDYHCSYFAGAFLVDGKSLERDLKIFFQKKRFDKDYLLNLISKYNTSSEVFFHRMMQVLPHYFGLNQLFFLRCYMKNNKRFEISKELHLSQLHNPHAVRNSEHYCRKWVTVKILQNLDQKISQNSELKIVDAQISQTQGSDQQYLCLSIARKSRTKRSTLSSLTIGILIDNTSKDIIEFLGDEEISKETVAVTCERCSDESCSLRAAEPTIYSQEIEKKNKQIALEKITNSILHNTSQA